MDLQKEQDSNAHGLGWKLAISKHWDWNCYWDWKYCIFLKKGDDTVRVTASTKLCDLLITWSCDKCKALCQPFRNAHDHQNWQIDDLQWGTPPSKSYDLLITWFCHVTNEKNIFTLVQYLWLTNLAEWYLTVGRPHAPSHNTFWSLGHVTNVKPYIWISAISMATKLGRVKTYIGGSTSTNSHIFW